MSWTELVTLLLMDAWRTMTGRNRQDPDVGDLFDEERNAEEEEQGDEQNQGR